MAADAVAEIKARLDIVDVVGGYITLTRAGRAYKGLCPFHSEKTPSFQVSQEKQAWYCFGCSEGGDIFSFVEKIERTDFRGALTQLAERAGVELEERAGPAQHGAAQRRKRVLDLNSRAQAYFAYILWDRPEGEPGRALLAERGVSAELARQFGVGFAPAGGRSEDALVRYLVSHAGATLDELVEAGLAHHSRGGGGRDRFRHRLVFPIRDERAAVIAFGARALGDAVPKYLNSPETAVYHKSMALFGIDLARDAIREAGGSVVVEGYFDVVAAHAAGVRNAVASSGTAFTAEQAKVLARYGSEIVLCFDADSAGRTAASRAADTAAAAGLNPRMVVLAEGFKDPDEMVRASPERYREAVAAAPPAWQVLLDDALAGGEGRGAEAQAQAAERAVAVLQRIPNASARDLYVQQVVRRLELSEASLRTDLARAHQQASARPQRIVAAAPEVVAPETPAVHQPEAAPIPEPSSWEASIGAAVVNRPGLARVLVTELGMGVGEIENPAIRRLVELALEAPEGTSLPFHVLGEAEQSLVARLLLRDLPELQPEAGPDAIRRLLADDVERIREARIRVQQAAVRRDLRIARDAGREDEVNRLAEELSRLAAQTQPVRRRSTTR